MWVRCAMHRAVHGQSSYSCWLDKSIIDDYSCGHDSVSSCDFCIHNSITIGCVEPSVRLGRAHKMITWRCVCRSHKMMHHDARVRRWASHQSCERGVRTSRVKGACVDLTTILCPPNEEFGRMNKRWNLIRIFDVPSNVDKSSTHIPDKYFEIRISSFVHPSKIFAWGA